MLVTNDIGLSLV